MDCFDCEKEIDANKRWNDARNKAISWFMESFWRDQFRETPSLVRDYVPLVYGPAWRDKFEKYVFNRRSKRYKWIMITANFMEGAPLKEIRKKVEKCLKKKWIAKASYCYEWRDKDVGLHWHCKMEIKDGSEKDVYSCKRECYNTFKDLCGHKMHVNVRYSNIEGCFDDYIKGLKKGELKVNNKYDVMNRKKFDLY